MSEAEKAAPPDVAALLANCQELNPASYSEDDVVALNNWAVDAHTALLVAHGRAERLEKIIREYVSELDNPVPCWAMKTALRNQMRAALSPPAKGDGT